MDRKQSILAVDDEPDMLRLLERIIRNKTLYEIRTTSNSLEVPGILEEHNFDLVITDLKMPGLDGLDILRWLRERKRTEQVIVITAFGSLKTATEALAEGVFDYITKPFKKEQILFSVDRVMHYCRMQDELKELAAVFEVQPLEKAVARFRITYLQRLLEKEAGHIENVAKIAGISEHEIKTMLAH